MLLLVGCAHVGGSTRGGDAAAVMSEFLRAATGGEPETGCGLLAPKTRQALEERAEQPCAAALPEVGLPGVGEERSTDVYVDQALVVLSTDTVFLAEFDEGWRVTAAGAVDVAEN